MQTTLEERGRWLSEEKDALQGQRDALTREAELEGMAVSASSFVACTNKLMIFKALRLCL